MNLQFQGRTWVDTTVTSAKEAFDEGLTTNIQAPSGKGMDFDLGFAQS